MKCFGKYNNDKTCWLCEVTNNKEFSDCFKIVQDETDLRSKLYNIKSKCPHRNTCYDEYDKFYGCNKDGNGYGRHAKQCDATLECEKYLK